MCPANHMWRRVNDSFIEGSTSMGYIWVYIRACCSGSVHKPTETIRQNTRRERAIFQFGRNASALNSQEKTVHVNERKAPRVPALQSRAA